MIEALLGGRALGEVAGELIRPALYLVAAAVAWMFVSAHYYGAGYDAAMSEVGSATADLNAAIYTASEVDALVRSAAEKAREAAREAVFEQLVRDAIDAPTAAEVAAADTPGQTPKSCPPQPVKPSCGLPQSVLDKINRVN